MTENLASTLGNWGACIVTDLWGVGDRRKEVAAAVAVGDAEGAAATSGSRSDNLG